MRLENVVFDAREPRRLGRFWQTAVAAAPLTDEPDGYETRCAVDGGPVLDLCFQRVADPAVQSPRLALQLAGGRQDVDRLLGLGARLLDDGSDTPVRLTDPEGNPFTLATDGDGADGALAALLLEVADPVGDAGPWA